MIKIIVVIVILLAAAGYYTLQNGVPDSIPIDVISTKISRSQAVEKIKKLPEVQQYLKNVPNGKVEVDNELEGEYNVHVYEVKNGHTATFNWYRVSIKSGEVRAEFEVVQNLTGTVTGKLCYPSEVLPEGKIEAKRLSDGEIFIQDYKGSLAREPEPYAFELEEGDYYLRYYVAKNLIGYSTTVCPTGMEESCGDKNPRILRKAQVKKDQVISGYDLCDYYYKDSNAPKFSSSSVPIQSGSAKGVIIVKTPTKRQQIQSPLTVNGFVYGNNGLLTMKLKQKDSGLYVAESKVVKIEGKSDQISFAESLQFGLPAMPQTGVLEIEYKDASGKKLDDKVEIEVEFPSDLGKGI